MLLRRLSSSAAYLRRLYCSQHANDYYGAALELYRQQKYDEALKHINQQTKMTSVSYKLKADVLFQLGRMTQTNAYYSASLLLQRNNADAFYKRGQIRKRLGRLSEALSDFKLAVYYDPSCQMMKEAQDKMAQELKVLNPKLDSYFLKTEHFERASGLFRNSRDDEESFKALDHLEKALAIDPNYDEALLLRAEIYCRRWKKGEAKYHAQKALQCNCHNDRAWLMMMIVHAALYRDLVSAEKYILKGMESVPASIELAVALSTLIRYHKRVDLVSQLEQYIQGITSQRLLRRLVEMYQAVNMIDKVREVLNMIDKCTHYKDGYSVLYLALKFESIGDVQRSLAYLQAATDRTPEIVERQATITARLLKSTDTRQLEQCIASLDSLLRFYGATQLLVSKAEILAKLGRFDEAKEIVEVRMKYDPTHERLRGLQEAISHRQTLFAEYAPDATSSLLLEALQDDIGYLLYYDSSMVEAIERKRSERLEGNLFHGNPLGWRENPADQFANVLRIVPNSADYEFLAAVELLVNGQFQQALAAIQRSSELDPNPRETLFVRMVALLACGDIVAFKSTFSQFSERMNVYSIPWQSFERWTWRRLQKVTLLLIEKGDDESIRSLTSLYLLGVRLFQLQTSYCYISSQFNQLVDSLIKGLQNEVR